MAADAGTSREPMVAVDSTHITADRSAAGAKGGWHRHQAPGTKESVTEPAPPGRQGQPSANRMTMISVMGWNGCCTHFVVSRRERTLDWQTARILYRRDHGMRSSLNNSGAHLNSPLYPFQNTGFGALPKLAKVKLR
jgi:hypothetical protein